MGRWWLFSALLLVGFSGAGSAEEDALQRGRLLALVAEVEDNPSRVEAAMEAGRERTILCANCHGEDGNSKFPDVPNLAGQNPTYLFDQIDQFSDGRRKNFVMQSLSRSFTTEDKVNIAVFFSRQQVKPVSADKNIAIHGQRIFQASCQMCHGADGRGEEGYARIAGQQTEYVALTLRRFRHNAKDLPAERDMKRHNLRMEQVSQSLSDQDIQALAHYIALLR